MDEAERTLWKNDNGEYRDLNIQKKLKGEKIRLDDSTFMKMLQKVRLRHYLTPGCNLECFFCSNEGLEYYTKKNSPARIDLITKLSDMVLEETTIRAIDFSGGEPLSHPDFVKEEYTLISWMKTHPDIKFAIHTNGILLKPTHTDMIAPVVSRLGISVHSTNFHTWNKITNPRDRYSRKDQESKFRALQENLQYLSTKEIGDKVFMKAVIIKGVNDSEYELSRFLDKCTGYGFHPKFLQLEPQTPSQKNLVVYREEFLSKLERIGCNIPEGTPRKHDLIDYCPLITFKYKEPNKSKLGVHSIIGCGEIGACVACSTYICVYVKPSDDGNGLYIKPCSVLDTRFDLTHAIETGDKKHLVELIKSSREYLSLAPGLGASSWNKTSERC
jgi:molybdenum cofactor biosynthesis enzyme MoaA